MVTVFLAVNGCSLGLNKHIFSKLDPDHNKIRTEPDQAQLSRKNVNLSKHKVGASSKVNSSKSIVSRLDQSSIYQNTVIDPKAVKGTSLIMDYKILGGSLLENLAYQNQDLLAMLRLGEIYFYGGSGVVKDLSISKKWYTQAAGLGSANAMLMLGNIILEQGTSKSQIHQAMQWYQQGAKLGNINCMLALGKIHLGMYGSAVNYAVAMDYYTKAAGMGSLAAELAIAELINKKLLDRKKYNPDLAIINSALKISARSGDVNSMITLAEHYMLINNIKLALEYYHMAAARNFSQASLKLGLLYFTGELVNRDYYKAAIYFQQASDLGEVVAHYYLGEIYFQGLTGIVNINLALDYYNKAKAQKFVKAIVRLADLYFFGKLVDPDIMEAINLYQQAAMLNNSYASFILSILYAKGIILEQNLSNSVYWYKIGEKQPDQSFAKFEIGKLYELGSGFKKNYAAAEQWYSLAAELGLVVAQNKLADLYANNFLGNNQIEKALHWYKLAADQGYLQAQYNLATLLNNNSNAKIYSPTMAYKLMKKAAINGHKAAQYNLGIMYLNGIGTKVNNIKAYCWLSMAVSNNGALETDPEIIQDLINRMDFKLRKQAVLLEQMYRDNFTSKLQQY